MAIGLCAVPGCDIPQKLVAGLCSPHYQRKRKYGSTDIRTRYPRADVCRVPGCEFRPKARDLCSAHRSRERKTGDVQADKPVRRNVSGRHVVKTSGYARIRIEFDHPRAYKSRWILEHIIVMEQVIGRPLVKGENVHHINGVRDDNRPENLELWVTDQPCGQRPQDLVAWAKEILRRYS